MAIKQTIISYIAMRCFVSSWFCWSKQQLLLPLIGASRYELLVGAPASLLSANRRAVVANTLS
ncbi:hypothetical protein YC2023_097326 [Brassica napus]